MKKRTQKKPEWKTSIRLSDDFFLPATWYEVRMHELLVTQRDIVAEIENIRLEQKQQRQQIVALAGAINVLLGANEGTTIGLQ